VTPAIEARGIRKQFAKKRSIGELVRHPFRKSERVLALSGVDLEMQEGEILGLLGPNGAGKTTLLKIFSCLIFPDEGYARVRGIDTVRENRVKPLIGLVNSDERSFYWRLSARENLRFFARLYNVEGPRIGARIDELLERVDMLESADRPFSGYSSGMKQRVAIARALLHDPPILFMDEPTRSLDPAASLALRRFVQEQLKERDHKTILLATHNLHEAEELSDRVAILAGGRVRQVGTVDQVRRWGLEGERFALEIDLATGPVAGPFTVLSDAVEGGRRKLTVRLDDGTGFEELLRGLFDAGIRVRACDREAPDLEAAFGRILQAEQDPA